MVKIFINPGHGGKDPGAMGNNLKEKDLTLQIALKIGVMLQEYENVQIKYSRTTDVTLSNKEAVAAANAWGADFFLSVHINAGGGTGFESFIYEKLADSSVTNQMRNTIHAAIVQATGMKDRGKKKANFQVLRETKMNAMLTENGFIDYAVDAAQLKTSYFINDIAAGHVVGLVRAFGLKLKQIPATPPKMPDELYYVQVGAYADKQNAENLVNRLKAAGFTAIIK